MIFKAIVWVLLSALQIAMLLLLLYCTTLLGWYGF